MTKERIEKLRAAGIDKRDEGYDDGVGAYLVEAINEVELLERRNEELRFDVMLLKAKLEVLGVE